MYFNIKYDVWFSHHPSLRYEHYTIYNVIRTPRVKYLVINKSWEMKVGKNSKTNCTGGVNRVRVLA